MGQNAYQDAIGTLSALTGGRANTAAASAAGQQQNAYMQQLSNIIPQLEQQAYGRHQDIYNNLAQQLGLLQGLDQNDYSRFSGERAFDYGVTRDMVSDDRYDTGVAKAEKDEAKNEWISTIEQFSADYQKEINRINAKVAAGDTSEQWKVPYLSIARQDKIKQQNADAEATATAKANAQASGNLTAYNRALDRWKTSGVVSSQADADILGVPVGTKTAAASKSTGVEDEPVMKVSDYVSYIDSTFNKDQYKTVMSDQMNMETGKYDIPIQVKVGKALDRQGLIAYLISLSDNGVAGNVIDGLATKYGITDKELGDYIDLISGGSKSLKNGQMVK